jgi:hypothetical protein
MSVNKEVNKVFKYRNTRHDNGNTQNRNRSTSRYRVKPKQRSKSQSRIDFVKLGIKNLCIHGGWDNHTMKECNTNRNSLKCSACKRFGHVNKVCIWSLMDVKSKASTAKPEITIMSITKKLLIIMGWTRLQIFFKTRKQHRKTVKNILYQ